MRITVVGLGAIGGLYGGLLARAGHEVRFLVRRDAAAIRRDGLTVASHCCGTFTIAGPTVVEDPGEAAGADVVLWCLKTTANGELARLLPRLIAPDGVVVLIQNGLGAEDDAAAVLGDAAVAAGRIVGGLAFVCANRVGVGRIDHLDYGKLVLGTHGATGISPRLAALAGLWRDTGIEVVAGEDLLAARWRKLVWNVPYNGLSVVLDATTDRLMADPDAVALITTLMEEVCAGSAAVGRPIEAGWIADRLDHTRTMRPYKTSMKLDHDARRPMELDAIYARPLASAARAGVAMPATTALWRQLAFLDRRSG